jgi:hypothetical protein
MWRRVVMATGYKSVAEAQANTTYPEFLRWCAFYRLEPWGAELFDTLFANVIDWMYALWTGKDAPKKKLDDFLLFFGDKRSSDPSELEARLRVMAGINRGKK